MTKARQEKFAKYMAMTAAVIIALCVVILTVDYAIARVRAPQDDELILELQEKVAQDSSLAPELAAEHERITAARQARKSRINIISIILIAASAAFISGVKWRTALEGRHLVPMEKLVLLKASPASAKPSKKKPQAGESPPSTAPAAPEIDLTVVDQIVEREGRGKEAAVPILQAIQNHFRYLPDEALRRVCELTEITPAQIAGTSSFYSQFRRSPVGKHIVKVCHGTACHVSGARQITEEVRRHLAIPDGEDTDADRMFTVEEVACLGCCSLAPVLMVDEHTAGRLTPASACEAIDAVERRQEV